jgi:nucleoside-diphosphate-sugar epimerase
MRIAITGGRGLVGRKVTEVALAQGHQVVTIDRATGDWGEQPQPPGLTHREADITGYPRLLAAAADCDALIHLAAIGSPKDVPMHEVHNNNVTASYNALCVAVELGMRHVCLASSINAIGGAYSRWPRYDYFPVDERHPTYNEDPYSLSKWICEAQADSVARRFPTLTISTLRLHGVVSEAPEAVALDDEQMQGAARQLWGYTTAEASARACLLALTADFTGHEVFYVVAPENATQVPTLELCERYFPQVPVVGDLTGHRGLFDCAKAEKLLGWRHDLD